MAKLVIREGARAGKEYLFPPRATSVLLGRAAESDLQVLDPQSSRHHAEITIDGSRFTLRDLGSSNGTMLNGRKIEASEEIRYGDRIRIGASEIELVDDSLEDEGLPSEIPGHRLLEKIGSGGMGTVYKAQQLSMDRLVAVKILNKRYSNDRTFIGRFVREARAAGRLGHPNVIHVNDVGEAGDVHYFSMEYVDGTTVKRILKEEGRLDVDRALDVIVQTARALKYAHDNGIIHRDIKPDNIMMNKEGVVKISDLGIAKTFDDTSTHGGERRIFGTPHYMSPEQALGKDIDGRADIYSLGASFYHMLTGSTPFTGRSVVEVLKAHIEGRLPPVQEKAPEVPDSVVFIVEKMMARQPDKRYPAMTDLIEDLERVQHDREAEIERLEEGESSVIPRVKSLISGRRRKQPREKREGEEPRKLPPWVGILTGVGVVAGLVGLFLLTVFAARRLGGGEGPEDILENAREFRRAGLDDDAREALERLLDMYPTSPQAVLARELLEELGGGEELGEGEDLEDREGTKEETAEGEPPVPPPGTVGEGLPPAEPEEALKRVEELEARGDLERALAELRNWMERFPEKPEEPEGPEKPQEPELLGRAKALEKRLGAAIRERNERTAREALAAIDEFAAANPRDTGGLIARLEALAETFGGTQASAEAASRAEALAEKLAAERAEAARRDFARAREVASEARSRGDYDAAGGAYRGFLRRHAGSRQAAQARAEAEALARHVQAAFEEALAESNHSLEAGRYKLAFAPLERFLKNHKSAKWNAEAQQRIAALEKEIEGTFHEEHEKVGTLLAAFNYEDAGVQYRLLAARFGGTRWERFVESRLREVEAQKALHRELVRRINAAGPASPRELPFPAPGVPEKMASLKWRVIKASETEATLGAGPQNRTLRSCRWEEFEAPRLVDLFELFFPEPTRDEHFALAYLCKEKGLEERARRHLAAAASGQRR